jgi:hypothetical protein
MRSERTSGGQISVAYEVSGTDWRLSVADNGVGKPNGVLGQPKKGGLGTGIVTALAKQLHAQVETLSGPQGTTVSLTHATFGGNVNPTRPQNSLVAQVPKKSGKWSKQNTNRPRRCDPLLADGAPFRGVSSHGPGAPPPHRGRYFLSFKVPSAIPAAKAHTTSVAGG